MLQVFLQQSGLTCKHREVGSSSFLMMQQISKSIFSGKFLAACVLSMLSFISSAQSPFDCANGLGYIIGNRSVSGANISDFYSYELSSGTATIIKQNIIDPTLGGSRFVNAIGFNPIDNYIWGVRVSATGSPAQMVRLQSNGTVDLYPVAGLVGSAAGDISPAGKMYFLTSGSSFELVDLNPSSPGYLTRSTLAIAPSIATPANDVSFNPVDGMIYLVSSTANRTLYRIDPATGTSTNLGNVTGLTGATDNSFGTAFFDNAGNMYIGNNVSSNFYKIATTQTGNSVATLYSSSPTGFSPGDGARCSSQIVLPAAGDDIRETTKNTAISINILSSDGAGTYALDVTSVFLVDPADGVEKKSVTIPGQGTFTANADGTVSFQPFPDYVGVVTTVPYTVKDSQGNKSNIADIRVTITDPMPVTLVRFDAAKEGNAAELTWSTTEETQSAYFEIQRKTGGTQWQNSGTVAAKGESATLVQYHFTDAYPRQGENLYRLKMVDTDGSFAYSRIQSVQFDAAVSSAVFVYPNPSSDKIFFDKDAEKIKSIQLFNTSGKVVLRSGKPTGGFLNVAHLGTGAYVVHLEFEDGTKAKLKVVLKN